MITLRGAYVSTFASITPGHMFIIVSVERKKSEQILRGKEMSPFDDTMIYISD